MCVLLTPGWRGFGFAVDLATDIVKYSETPILFVQLQLLSEDGSMLDVFVADD